MLATTKHIASITLGSTKNLLIWIQLGERGEEKEPIKFLDQKVLYTSPVFMRTEFTVISSIPHTTSVQTIHWLKTCGGRFCQHSGRQTSSCIYHIYSSLWCVALQLCLWTPFFMCTGDSSRVSASTHCSRHQIQHHNSREECRHKELNGHIRNRAIFSPHSNFLCLRQ